MRAKLLVHEKLVTSEGDIIEIIVWKVPVNLDFPEGIKYRMVYIHGNERILGYDNERGKKHHSHRFGKETTLEFRGWKELVRRFREEVYKIRGELYGNKG